MRRAFCLLTLAGVVLGHAEGSRNAGGGVPVIVVPHGGVTPTDSRGAPTTVAQDGALTGWETWWAYNREYFLARRVRGRPVSGGPRNDRVERKALREGRLRDVMREALDDKSPHVRASAAVALGKFGLADSNRDLARHCRVAGEGWFFVREAALYGRGILGLEENRAALKALADDEQVKPKERGLALVSLGLDGSEDSVHALTGYLRYHRSSLRFGAGQTPEHCEEEQRRMAAHMLGFAKAEGLDELLLHAGLGSRKWGPGVQGLALTALARRGARDYVKPLFRILADRQQDDAVKQSAAIALGRLIRADEAAEVRRLARVVRDHRRDNVLQRFAVMALAEIGGETATEALLDLRSGHVFANEEDRAFVQLALGVAGERSKPACEALMADLDDARTPTERCAIALALALAGHDAAVAPTIRLLEKTSAGKQPELLAYGALALGLHGDPRGVPVVREILRKYAIPSIRQNAAMALALLRRNEAVPELVEILEESGNVYTKAAAVTALGLLPEPSQQAVDALIEAYRKDSTPESVRDMAIIALGALADPRAIPLSAQMTRHYNYYIRCQALDEIARLL